MFASKKLSLNEWKNWTVGLVDSTMSSIDQATSRWFWNLINGLPRDYFAKTFDQVNYLDKRVWEGIFRARVEDIKEQLESGVSKKTFETDIIELQGLIGKHSLSPLVYEDGLKELEDFVSNSNNSGKHLQLLANVRNEFREELRAQPLLLKECIKNDTNLGQREVAYYQSLLDSTSSKETPVKPSALGKSVVSKNGGINSKLRNISKLLFCNPAQAVTLFLAGQVAFANAVSIQLNNSSAVENSTLPFENKLFNLSEVKGDLNSNISIYNALNEATTLKNVSGLRLEEKADKVEEILANSTLSPFNNNITDTDEVAGKVMISPSSRFAEIPEGKVEGNVTVNTAKSSHSFFTKEFNDEIEKVKNGINKLIIALTQTELDETVRVDVRRSQRSISINTINNPNPSGIFTRPDLSIKSAKLENEMRKMKEDIAQLKQSLTVSSQNKARLASLETTVEALRKLLDDQSKELTHKIANLGVFVDNLINLVNGFRKELDDMKKKAAEQETIQKQKGLPAECVEAIKSHNFKAAEEKLQEINDDSKINFIIKEVYDDRIGRFDLVLKFGDSVRNIGRSFLVYKALNYEMESNGHKDPFKMMDLIESLRKEIINQSNTSSEIKEGAESIVSSLKDRVKAVAKERLKDGMLNDRYASVKEIADKVYNFDGELFGNTIKEAVSDVCGRVDTEKILSMILSHSVYIPQVIPGYVAVFDNMRRNGDLNDGAILKLTSLVKEIMEMPNYRNVDQQFKSDLESLKNRLPESVKNAVFSSKVCIKNVRYNEYLFADLDRKYDSGRRYVFTFIPGGKTGDSLWEIESERNHFFIKNVQYSEYLYAASYDLKYDDERRSVFTWTSGERVIQGTWQIEPNGNNVHIRNTKHSEYLFADFDRKYDSGRRYVFTFIPERKTEDSLWSIEDCSSGRRKRDAEAIEAQNNIINVTAQQEEKIGKDVKPSSKIHDLTLENVSQNISSVAR